MGKDQAARFHGNIDELKIKLSQYIKSENREYDELTLNYLDKWIWIYTYDEDYGIYLDINFSKDFSEDEIKLFINGLKLLGFDIEY